MSPRRPACTSTTATTAPPTRPPSTPYPISSSRSVTALRPSAIPDSTSAIATAANRSGTQIPSLSPLSTLSPCRTRPGTRGSVTTAWPSAASVGARTTARMTASWIVSWSRTSAPATAPSPIVSGSPIPSSRTGTPASRRSSRRSMLEASENSTSASVASASVRTVSLEDSTSTSPSTRGPMSTPTATNTIAGVTGVPYSRREIAATPSNVAARIASDHSMAPSEVRLRRHASRRDGGAHGVVVALVLVGVQLREGRHRAIEALAASEVAGDRDGVAGACVGLGERLPAELGVQLHERRVHQLDQGRPLAVPELTHVEVAAHAVRRGEPDPAEQDVAGRLRQPLALDDVLAGVREGALAQERLEHGRLRLLELQDERVGVVAAEQEDDPGAGPHAADAYHLARRVHVAIALQQPPPIGGERAPVGADDRADEVLHLLALDPGHDVLDRDDERRVADDPELAVDDLGQLRERSRAVLRPCLREVALEHLALLRGASLGGHGGDVVEVDPRVPDVQVRHAGV